MSCDKSQLVVRTDLAVSDIEKIGHASKLAQLLPALDMGSVIGTIPCMSLVVDRYRAVGDEAQREHDLFQIMPMILAVSAQESYTGGSPSGH